jgi:hypothetical protein
MEEARDRRLAWGGTARQAAEAARELVLAQHPPLPLTLIAEAVAAVVPDPEGLAAARGELPAYWGGKLRLATAEELAESLAYSLRFNEGGRRRPVGHEFLAPLAAAQLVRHLAMAGYVVMKRPPAPRHSTP